MFFLGDKLKNNNSFEHTEPLNINTKFTVTAEAGGNATVSGIFEWKYRD